MALATKCPHCQTTFRVAHDQLKLRAGIVRCGACHQIFNGIEHLLRPEEALQLDSAGQPETGGPDVSANEVAEPSTPAAPATPLPEEAAPIPAADLSERAETLDLAEPAVTDHATVEPEGRFWSDAELIAHQPSVLTGPSASLPSVHSVQEGRIEPTLFAPEALHATPGSEEASIPELQPQNSDDIQRQPFDDAGPDNDDDTEGLDISEAEEPSFVTRGRRQQRFGRTRRILLSCACAFLLIALLAQVSYTFRSQLAARFPLTRPLLSSVCATLGCQLGLPMNLESVSIESSELQAQPGNGNTFALSLLLRNRAATVQAWPHIELSLNDGNERPVARRVFTPHDYLPPTQDASKGISSNSEQAVKLYFELSQLKASGYRAYLFYP